MNYLHFSIEERETIQELLWQGQSIRSIATKLGRAPSSVSRELTKNCPQIKRYTPRLAQERARKKAHSRGREKRLKNDQVREYVTTQLKEGWSPEQIAGRIRLDLKESISHEAIYQYIYHQVHREGWGLLKGGCVDLRSYLRRKRKRRQRKGTRPQRILSHAGLSIEERPPEVMDRLRYGDWEGDTVCSKDYQPGINTLVERKSGYLCITKLESNKSEATTRAIIQKLASFPPELRQTLTLDNGKENMGWREVESSIKTKIYFAHPYSSWERGTNENTNGLIRQYFPKKTDFSQIPVEHLARVESILNNRPRKRLNYQTPLEVMGVALTC
jgi:IS30 family transposase